MRNDGNLGDRTLAAWYGPKELIFSTYNYSFIHGSQRNLVKHIKLNQEDDSWIFIYMAYSQDMNKVYAYIRLTDNDYTLDWINTRHFVPTQFTVFLGKDPYYKSFNGYLKAWHFAGGKRAYTEDGETLSEFQNSPDCFGRGEDDNQIYEELITSSLKSKSSDYLIEKEIQQQELQQGIYGFTLWFRWSFSSPDLIQNPHIYKKGCINIARMIQNEILDSLSLSICSSEDDPAIQFSTYNLRNNTAKQYQNFKIDEANFDGCWNWVYFVYDQNNHETSSMILYSWDNTIKFQLNQEIYHHNASYLRFILGGNIQNYQKFNGYFYQIRMIMQKEQYFSDQQNVYAYYLQAVGIPPSFQPPIILQNQQINKTIQQQEYNFQQQKNFSLNKEWFDELFGVQQYAVFGWAKWNGEQIQDKTHILFRLTQIPNQNFSNQIDYGDRVFYIILTNTTLLYSTYSIKNSITPNLQGNFSYNYDNLKNWFWVYYGYSRQFLKTYIYIKWNDGSISEAIQNNVLHIVPSYLAIYLGQDVKKKQQLYFQFQGSVKNFNLILGNNAFKTQQNDMEQLMKEIDNNNEIYTVNSKIEYYEETDEFDNLEQFFNPLQVVMDDDETSLDINPYYPLDETPVNNTWTHHHNQTYEFLLNISNITNNDEQNITNINQEIQKNPQCGILFSQCNFQGRSIELCQGAPIIKDFGSLKSIYVPEDKKITVYSQQNYQGLKAEFYQTIQCIESVNYHFLLKHKIKITRLSSIELQQLEINTQMKNHLNKQGDYRSKKK